MFSDHIDDYLPAPSVDMIGSVDDLVGANAVGGVDVLIVLLVPPLPAGQNALRGVQEKLQMTVFVAQFRLNDSSRTRCPQQNLS